MPHVDIPQGFCRAGVARRDITPPVGIYHRMWGAATHDRSTGVHRPLEAAAPVLAPATGEPTGDLPLAAIVAVDHCLLWKQEMDELEHRVCAQAGIPLAALQVAFSHTHGAGLMGHERRDLPGGDLIPPYLEHLADEIAAAIKEAIAHLQPAEIVYGQGKCSLAAHRDFWDEKSRQFVCGFNPGAMSDDTLVVARVTSGGKTLANVVNYACHPTTLAWDNTLISPDFIGAMRETIQAATGAPLIFMQGASGDLGPREGFVGDVAVADRNGRQLAYAALSALEALPSPGTRYEFAGPVVSGATIGVWKYVPVDAAARKAAGAFRTRHWTIPVPYRPDLPTLEKTKSSMAEWQAKETAAKAKGDAIAARDARAQVERMTRQIVRLEVLPPGPAFPLQVTLLQVGGGFWLLAPGEFYQELQIQLRRGLGSTPLIVSTVTGGWGPSYFPTATSYGKGIYQETVALVDSGALDLVIADVREKLAEWRV